MYGVRLVPSVDSSVADLRLQVPEEQIWPAGQSASLLQEAASAGALASSAAPSESAETNFQVIRPSLSARDRALTRQSIDQLHPEFTFSARDP